MTLKEIPAVILKINSKKSCNNFFIFNFLDKFKGSKFEPNILVVSDKIKQVKNKTICFFDIDNFAKNPSKGINCWMNKIGDTKYVHFGNKPNCDLLISLKKYKI